MRRRDKLTPIIHVQDIRSARDGGVGVGVARVREREVPERWCPNMCQAEHEERIKPSCAGFSIVYTGNRYISREYSTQTNIGTLTGTWTCFISAGLQ